MRVPHHQPGLFDTPGDGGERERERVLVEDAECGIRYRPGLVDAATAGRWFEALRDGIAWQSQRRPMYDRVVDVPRLTASWRLGDPGLPPALREAADAVLAAAGEPFNAVGLNYYRDGNDSVAPHGDKLHMLVPRHPIALLSLGSTRRMAIRPKRPPRRSLQVDLEPGSLLLMSYDSQLHYEHGVPKTREPVGPRISLAFRVRPLR
jgi:alkylated DNA repair dioxygenase AlkB